MDLCHLSKWLKGNSHITGYIPGFFLVVAISFLAKMGAVYIPVGSVVLAILLGILTGNLLRIDKIFYKGIDFAEKKFLAVAIMLLGLQLDVSILRDLGLKSLMLIVLIVFTAIGFAYLLGKVFKISTSFSLLLGIGNGICGSSAIAGAAPLLNAKEDETGLSISIVNFLGTAGIFLVPLVTGLLLRDFSVKSGMLIGGTLQAVGQVTAAGFGVNDEVGRIATIIKMGRILTLGPVLLLLSFIYKRNTEKSIGRKFPIPGFILGFIILAIIANCHLIPSGFLPILKRISKEFLIMAMAGVGLKILFSSIVKQGPKALLLGAIVFIMQVSVGVLFIICFC
ncbi:putative sulfate exporter family transporter [bacterium]|nr:putative sulfate exporter family transporter [bacterium]